MLKQRGREIPWLPIVKFHKEIVARAEQGFFSINRGDDQDERWTSLTGFDPEDLAGPWQIKRKIIHSRQFLVTLEQDRHESVFMGGPCFLAWAKSSRGKWLPQLRPLLYREVELRPDEDIFNILPKQGAWSVTPLLCGLLERLEITVGIPFDEFAVKLIEKATAYLDHEKTSLENCIFKALFSEVSDVEPEK